MGRAFRACVHGIDGGFHTMNDKIVDAVFDIRRVILGIEKFALVGFVIGEQEFRTAFAVKPAGAVVIMVEFDGCDLRSRISPQVRPALV